MEVHKHYRKLLGHGVIPEDESPRAKLWKKIFFKGRILILLFLSFQWYLELNDILNNKQIFYANLTVLIFFLTELILITSLLKNKKSYLIRSWPIPIIVGFLSTILISPNIFHEEIIDGARLLLIIWLSIPCIELCITSLSDNKLSTTIYAATFFIIFSGVIISGIDPSINNPWDGIWWAWVTITTVGYGDIVPSSIVGRALGFPLILTGLLLFAAFTANFSAIFLKHRLKKNLAEIVKEEQQIKEMIYEIKTLSKNVEKLEKHIEEINKKI